MAATQERDGGDEVPRRAAGAAPQHVDDGRLVARSDPSEAVTGPDTGRRAAAPRRPTTTDVLRALALGAVAAVLGGFLWVAGHRAVDVEMGWLGLLVGLLVGAAVVVAARRRRGVVLVVVSLVLTLAASALSQNFLQRAMLLDGIDELEARWSDLQVPLPGEGGDAADALPEPPEGAVIPPPEIVAVLPVGAYQNMPPETLAIIWDDVPADVMGQLDPAFVAEAEQLRAAAEAGTGDASIAAARAEFEQTDFDLPDPVAECAPPPDFTKPTAADGLGFADGVPLLLPASDYFSDWERTDGQDYAAPSPACFARESIRSEPVQSLFWLLGFVAAAVIPSRTRLSPFAWGRR